MKDNNIFKQNSLISIDLRSNRLKQKPKLIWFTGLSGSGKTTLSIHLEKLLFEKGFSTYVLDGDNVRLGLCNDLGFSVEDRYENIRRISEVSKLLLDAGIIVLSSFISPLKSHREHVRKTVGAENYIEIFVSTPLDVCEERDTKGLYKKARKGYIKNFTGISSDFEYPKNPKIKIDTTDLTIKKSVGIIFKEIKKHIYV